MWHGMAWHVPFQSSEEKRSTSSSRRIDDVRPFERLSKQMSVNHNYERFLGNLGLQFASQKREQCHEGPVCCQGGVVSTRILQFLSAWFAHLLLLSTVYHLVGGSARRVGVWVCSFRLMPGWDGWGGWLNDSVTPCHHSSLAVPVRCLQAHGVQPQYRTGTVSFPGFFLEYYNYYNYYIDQSQANAPCNYIYILGYRPSSGSYYNKLIFKVSVIHLPWKCTRTVL